MTMSPIQTVVTVFLLSILMAGCTPPVGSEAWCKQTKDKDAGDWSANEAADYAKHCLFQKN